MTELTLEPGTIVAVLGTGIMGSAMARNLLAAGLPTTVWDRSAAATGPLAEAGAQVAASAPEAVRDARVVITMLPTPDVVHDVIFDGGVAGEFAEGAAWAQMGTIGVAATAGAGGQELDSWVTSQARVPSLLPTTPTSCARELTPSLGCMR